MSKGFPTVVPRKVVAYPAGNRAHERYALFGTPQPEIPYADRFWQTREAAQTARSAASKKAWRNRKKAKTARGS